MATVNYTIRLDETDKQSAELVFNQLGLTMAAGLNVYIKAVARQQRIPFELALNEPSNPASSTSRKPKSQTIKKSSLDALCGVLSEYEIDINREREERKHPHI